MPSDWAIQQVLDLRLRQMQQTDALARADGGIASPTALVDDRFNALIGELLDEVRWRSSREDPNPR